MSRRLHSLAASTGLTWLRTGLAALLLAASAASCGPPPRGQTHALRAVPRDPLGQSVLSFRWKLVTADRSRELRPQEFARPIVWNEMVYVGSQSGTFWALSAHDGRVRWKRTIGAVSTAPALHAASPGHTGWLFVGTDDGELIALDAQTGEIQWRYASRGPIGEPPVVIELDAATGSAPGMNHPAMVVFSNEGDQVYGIDALTGKFRWQYKGETPEEYTLRGHAGIASSGDLVFTGFANGTLVALRVANGSVAWSTSLTGGADKFIDVDATPVVLGETVYATSSSGGVYALDRTTGLVRWQAPLFEGGPAQPNLGNTGGIGSDGKTLYVASADQGIYALDLDGNILWRQGTRGGGEPAAPVVSGDYLLYALADEGLFIADKRTGEVLQWFDPGDGVSSPPTVTDDDRLFLLSNRGVFYAMDITR